MNDAITLGGANSVNSHLHTFPYFSQNILQNLMRFPVNDRLFIWVEWYCVTFPVFYYLDAQILLPLH